MTHICVGNLTLIGSDNGLSPDGCQGIIWTNAGILLIGPLGTNFSEILIEVLTYSFKKMRLNVSSAKWRPFCRGLYVLNMVGKSMQPHGLGPTPTVAFKGTLSPSLLNLWNWFNTAWPVIMTRILGSVLNKKTFNWCWLNSSKANITQVEKTWWNKLLLMVSNCLRHCGVIGWDKSSLWLDVDISGPWTYKCISLIWPLPLVVYNCFIHTPKIHQMNRGVR